MQPDQSASLARLQRRTAELAHLARDLGEAIPAHVEGSDATGWVLIVLGRDGLPTQIRVREGWRQRLEPDRLADAVLDANSDAMQRAMQGWTTAVDDGGWWRRRRDLEGDPTAETPFASRHLPPLPPGQARDGNELAEQVIRTLHDAQTPQTTPAAVGEGHDDGQHITVQISPAGLAGCTIDPDWAQRQDGAFLSAALSTALRRATVQRPVPSWPGAQVHSLVGDAFATLTYLTQTPTEGGDR